MEVEIRSSASGAPPLARVRRVLSGAANALGGEKREVSVYFCGDRQMAGLNRRWRRRNRPTDVLAFPAGETGARFLGDIVISVPYASRQARRRGESPAREMDRLLLHGYLHLLGYDHETDHGEMEALEAKLARRLNIAERAR
ncbi:MAG TPA: rRNA maturation RNase YbeY [Thermoanaerobaculia bacterium]|jgi:rRNA maturation RNase YbeY